MATGPIEKLHMVILMQPNLEAAITFYEQLGLKLIFHLKEKWAELRLGDVKVGLCPTQQQMDGFRTGMVLQVADLKQVYQDYKDIISFLSEPKEAVHGIMASFKDPGGNILDLYQPTPEKVTELMQQVAQEGGSQEEGAGSKSACAKGSSCCKLNENGVA